MQIRFYKPRHGRVPPRDDGSIKATFYTVHGVVEFFTFPGDGRHVSFTTFEIFLHPNLYYARLNFGLHPVWHRRYANQFAAAAKKKAKSEAAKVRAGKQKAPK